MGTDKNELLPCPFCGGMAHPKFDQMGIATCAWIRCGACVAKVYVETGGVRAAAQAWNLRAALASQSGAEVPSAEGAVIDYGSPQAVPSIDTPEFRKILNVVARGKHDHWTDMLIAHIDTRLRQVQPVSRDAAQPLIGKLMDEISQLPHLFPDGCKEPGALLRQSDVQRVLVAASKALASSPTAGSGEDGKQGEGA